MPRSARSAASRTEPQPLARQAAEQQRHRGDQDQERDVELTLNRHRPNVLQGTHRIARAQIIGRGLGEFPVLVVAQARPGSVPRTFPTVSPAGSGWSDAAAARTTTKAGRRRRTNRTNPTPGETGRRVPGRCAAASHRRRNRQHQKHVDSAGNPAEPHVKDRHQGDGHPAKTVEIVPIEAGPPRAHRRPSPGGSRPDIPRGRRGLPTWAGVGRGST